MFVFNWTAGGRVMILSTFNFCHFYCKLQIKVVYHLYFTYILHIFYIFYIIHVKTKNLNFEDGIGEFLVFCGQINGSGPGKQEGRSPSV